MQPTQQGVLDAWLCCLRAAVPWACIGLYDNRKKSENSAVMQLSQSFFLSYIFLSWNVLPSFCPFCSFGRAMMSKIQPLKPANHSLAMGQSYNFSLSFHRTVPRSLIHRTSSANQHVGRVKPIHCRRPSHKSWRHIITKAHGVQSPAANQSHWELSGDSPYLGAHSRS